MIRVLIVDDEYIMRQGLKYMIHWEQEGYEIVGEATNGNEALRLTEELKPHIIISDIVMSVMDGVAFTEMVHKIYPDIAIIILSGYDKFEYVKKTHSSKIQSLRGKKSHGGGRPSLNKPWLDMGVSRSTYFRLRNKNGCNN